jgi:hypothetical protein
MLHGTHSCCAAVLLCRWHPVHRLQWPGDAATGPQHPPPLALAGERDCGKEQLLVLLVLVLLVLLVQLLC